MIRLTNTAMMALMALATGQASADGNDGWRTDTTDEWQAAASQIEGLTMSDGLLALTDGHPDPDIGFASDWRELTEQYESIEGFAKQVKRIPASMDLSTLPEGYGFCFELCIEDTTANTSAPTLDRAEIRFQE